MYYALWLTIPPSAILERLSKRVHTVFMTQLSRILESYVKGKRSTFHHGRHWCIPSIYRRRSTGAKPTTNGRLASETLSSGPPFLWQMLMATVSRYCWACWRQPDIVTGIASSVVFSAPTEILLGWLMFHSPPQSGSGCFQTWRDGNIWAYVRMKEPVLKRFWERMALIHPGTPFILRSVTINR